MTSVRTICPETYPSRTVGLSDHLAQLALSGFPQLAADTILNREIHGRLGQIVGNAIRLLNFEFMKNTTVREIAYETLIEIAFNLIGVECKIVGFSEKAITRTLHNVVQTLKEWEDIERRESGVTVSAHTVIRRLLLDMKKVMLGVSMLAKMAEEIEKEIREDSLMVSFISAMEKAIKENVYYQMVTKGLSKLGNDSATGLRMVRHLGAVQVSSNPVIAARAYKEFSGLWDEFKEVMKAHPKWLDDSEKLGDEIALYATITSLLPNLLVFRPNALLSNFHDGLVSYQINPHKATSLEASLNDATKIYSILTKILEKYDAHLMWNTYLEGRGRPNMVFKVAGCSPAAIDITIALNRMGIGTNNTVTYTVAQEATLIMAAMKGLAEALKMGIPITQVYETNMIGRLEDHLREAEAERLLQEGLREKVNSEEKLRKLAAELGALEEIENTASLEEKIRKVCSKKYLKTLTDKRFMKTLKELRGDSKGIERSLSQLENDIEHSGILVTRKVYKIFFGRENKSKWMAYIQKEFGVSEEESKEVMDKIDLLASSKRRAEDTYLVMKGGDPTNLTNTEFPSQQLEVWKMSRREGFRLCEFKNSIIREPDAKMLERLLKIEDFRKAYELTPELAKKFEQIGIEGKFEEGGIKPEEWSSFGPVLKTMDEFKIAYNSFKQTVTEFVQKAGQSAHMWELKIPQEKIQ